MGMPVTGLWTQANFRFYEDDVSGEGNGTPIAAVDTNATFNGQDNIFRLRFLVQQTVSGYDQGAEDGTITHYLGYQVNGTGGYSLIGTASGSCRIAPTANLTDGDDTTQLLGAGTLITNNNGVKDTGTNYAYTGQDGLYEHESEWALQTFGLTNTDYVEFRLFTDSACTTSLDTVSVTPRITITGLSSTVSLALATTGQATATFDLSDITRGLILATTGQATATIALSEITRGLVLATTGQATVAGTLTVTGAPPGAGVQIYDKRIKPQPWNWAASRLSPRGRQLARGLVWATPLWEGSNDWARDVVGGDVLVEASGSEVSDGGPAVASWLNAGKAILFDYAQEGYALQGGYYPPQGSNPRTTWICGRPGAAPAVDSVWLAYGSSDGADDGANWGFGIRTTGVLKVAVFVGYAQGTTSVANRFGTYGAVLHPSDTSTSDIILYVDGEPDTGTEVVQTVNTGNITTGSNEPVSLGGQFRDDGTNNEYRSADVDVACAAIWDRALSEEELRWLHEDPFVLFRPEPEEPRLPFAGSTISLLLAANGQATTTIDLSDITRGLTAAISGQATVSLVLSEITRGLAFSTTGQATATFDISDITRGLTLSVAGQAQVDAVLQVAGQVALALAVNGQATVAGAWAVTRGLTMTAGGTSTFIADASITRSLQAAMAGQATVSANLSTGAFVTLVLAVNGQADVQAALNIDVALAAAIAGQASVAVSGPNINRLFSATMAGQATLSASLAVDIQLSALIAGQATTSFALGVLSSGNEKTGVLRMRDSTGGELDMDDIRTLIILLKDGRTL